MKKNFLLFICVLLCAALLTAVLTACNDDPQTVTPGGDGQTGEELPDGGLVFELASDGESYAVADYTGTSAEVVIPSVHEGLPVTSIGQYAFRGCSGLTSVTIGNGVTSIDPYAFFGCTAEIIWGDDPEITKIGESAFSGYQGTSITIPDSVTSIGTSAFYNCSGLTAVYITDIAAWCEIEFGSLYANPLLYAHDLSLNGELVTELVIPDSVTSIGWYAFEECSSLTSITIPDSVMSIGRYAFSGCSGLTAVYITDITAWCGIDFYDSFSNPLYYAHDLYLNGELVTELVIPDGMTSIGQHAFSGCTAEIVWGDDPGITEIGEYAFYGYKGTSITIPDSVASIGPYAFAYCTELTSVTIPNRVTSIGDSAFSGCRGLTSVTIPDRVTSIGDSAFYCCYGLTFVTIPDGVTSIEDSTFSGCSGLTSVTIGDGVTSIGKDAFSGCIKLVEVYNKSSLDIRAGKSENGYVGYYAKHIYTEEGGSWFTDTSDGFRFFYDGEQGYLMGYLGTETEIELPASFTAYNGTFVENYEIYEDAFAYCSDLTSIIIPDSVTSIGHLAFYKCSGLSSITIPDSVTSIGYQAFNGCSGLTSVAIGDSVTSIGLWAFFNCSGLTSIVVDDGNYVYHSAGNCIIETASKTLIVGCKNSIIPDDGSVTSIEGFAFENCDGLTTVTIPDSVTRIGMNAFSGCSTNLIEKENGVSYVDSWVIDFDESVSSVELREGTRGIADSAFEYCNGLTSITIPDGVTSIGMNAFSGCSSLTSVTIGGSVTSIGFGAFTDCSGLKYVTFEGTRAEWNAITKGYSWDYGCPFTYVVCSDGDVSV